MESMEAATAVGVHTSHHRYPVWKIIDLLQMQKLAFLSHLLMQILLYLIRCLKLALNKSFILQAAKVYHVCFSEGESIFISNSCKEMRVQDLIQSS